MVDPKGNNTTQRASAEPETHAQSSTGVAGRMTVAVIAGAVVGAVFGMILAPNLVLPLALGGAMAFGAGAVALFLFATDDGAPQGEARKK